MWLTHLLSLTHINLPMDTTLRFRLTVSMSRSPQMDSRTRDKLDEEFSQVDDGYFAKAEQSERMMGT